jgi:hypothetical protein
MGKIVINLPKAFSLPSDQSGKILKYLRAFEKSTRVAER